MACHDVASQIRVYFQRVTLFVFLLFVLEQWPYGNLPNNIKDINVLSSFKTEYKRILLDQFLDTS